MPQRQTQPAAQTQRAEEEAAPLASTSLRVVDYSGRRRQGSAIVLPRRSPGLISAKLEEGEDFRIIMLAEPPDGPVSPADGVVVVAPARLLPSAARLREAAPHRPARQQAVSFPAEDLELLRKGRLYSRAPLQARPEDVFAGDKPRLALLARDLLLSVAAAGYLQAVAVAMRAPGAANPATLERLGELQKLVEAVRSAGGSEALPELDAAASRLSQLASAGDAETLLLCAERLYPARQALTEDIYILRAFDRSPDQAGELLAVRRFLSRAAVPEEETDLTLDRSLLLEQLTFAALATEPNRLAPATAALTRFRQRYASLYRERHTSYWAEMARLHTRLVVEQEQLAAVLRRVNTLAELGPPAGVGALAAFGALIEETSGCPLIAGVEDLAAAEGSCPECSLSLDQSPPTRRVDEILKRIERACDRQMARLSSSAIQEVLHHSGDPRVDQFLKVVQASQLSSLCAVLDDDLVGYLRRFLVESRIHDTLEPILSRVQDGVPPNVDEAQSAMRDVSRVLQRAFQSAQWALPPGETEPKDGPSRRRRKR